MKRLILLFTLICTLSLTSLADTWTLNTWEQSGELNNLPNKTFTYIHSNDKLLQIDIPNGIDLKDGDLFGVATVSSGYFKWNTDIKKDVFNELHTGGDGGDAKITENFTCYQILIKFEDLKGPQIYFSSTKATPLIMTWKEGAFTDIIPGTAFTTTSTPNIYKLEIPEGSTTVSPLNKFLIYTSTPGGDIYYKSPETADNAANNWSQLSSANFNDIAVAADTYYKILFNAENKQFYNSTIPLSITPKAPTAKWNADNKIELELELPADITSVSQKFISKATITRTDATQATQTYEITKADLDDKASVTYVDVNTDLTAAANYTYTVVYEYIDYEGSTEILTTNPSAPFVVNTNTETSFKIFPESISNEALGNNIFVGFGAEWMPATTFSNLAPTYTLSYSTDATTWIDIADLNPTNENGVMKQDVYGVPNNAQIRITTTYGTTVFTGTNNKTHTFDYSEILTAPTTFDAKDLKRYGNDTKKNVAYSATISWENEALNPVSSWVVDYADANVTPIAYTNFSNDWAFNGVQNLNSTGITYTGDKYVAKIKYSIKANYSFGNKVQTTIADEDYARSTDVEIKASEALTADVDFVIDVSTGVEDATNNIVAIYPNPTTGTLVINNTTPIEKISIFNIAGSCVKDINGSNDTSATIDIEDLAQGTYFVKVNSSVTKVIKK